LFQTLFCGAAVDGLLNFSVLFALVLFLELVSVCSLVHLLRPTLQILLAFLRIEKFIKGFTKTVVEIQCSAAHLTLYLLVQFRVATSHGLNDVVSKD
jgi:hypothetical protein